MITTIAKYTDDPKTDLLLSSYAHLEMDRLKLKNRYPKLQLEKVDENLTQAMNELRLAGIPEGVKNKTALMNALMSAQIELANVNDGYDSYAIKQNEKIEKKLQEISLRLAEKDIQMNDSRFYFMYGILDEKMSGSGTKIKDELENMIATNNADMSKGKIESNLIMHSKHKVETIEVTAPFNSDVIATIKSYQDLLASSEQFIDLHRITPSFDFNNGEELAILNELSVPDFTYSHAICQNFIEQRPDLMDKYHKIISRERNLSNDHDNVRDNEPSLMPTYMR